MGATVIADASFCPMTKAAGWAAWVTLGPHARIKRSGAFQGNPKSAGEAEMWALMNGIKLAYQAGARNILAQTDCMSVVHAINNGNAATKLLLDRIADGARVVARHVKGHTTINEPRYFVNRWCDDQARVHMLKGRVKCHKTHLHPKKRRA